MKKIAIMTIFFLIVCFVAWMPAGFQKDQVQRIPPKKELRRQGDDLQAKVDKLEKELELLKKVIKIRGPDVGIQAAGTVKIRASNITVEAAANAQFKGAMVTVQAAVVNTIKGAQVLIN